jgi:6,7-dimethyl-8-ribityllumazine synthase
LLEGALKVLKEQGVKESNVKVVWVPGSFELPFAAKRLAASKKWDAVICLGALIRGETAHFDYIAQAASNGIEQASRETGIPIIFGVLTCDSVDQAMERVGGKVGHKGEEAALAALEMAHLNSII